MNRNSFIVTGASGFVGRSLVPILSGKGFSMLIVGRNKKALVELFPGTPCCTYDELKVFGTGYTFLLHLAAENDSTSADEEAYYRANVLLFKKIIEISKHIGVSALINFTSFHAVDGRPTLYGKSKARALEVAHAEKGVKIINFILPAIYTNEFSGRLSFIDRFPDVLKRPLRSLVGSLTPTVDIEKVVGGVLDLNKLSDKPKDLFFFNSQQDNIIYTLFKRMVDYGFAIFILVFFWWFLLIVAALIRLDSSGPSIFVHQRVGRYGKAFPCYKFRTMLSGTKQVGTHEISDTYVTKFGAVLRKTKIDELPQILNLFRGDISLIGPRPSLPNQTELIRLRTESGALTVRPGITGLAQINNIDMTDPEILAAWDARYVAQQSIFNELRIIFLTSIGKGQGDRVLQK